MKNIRVRVNNVIKKYGTRNPTELAKELNITIVKRNYSMSTKGYFLSANGRKFIVINSMLDEISQKVVLAHELGHALLHSSKGIYFMRDNILFPRGIVENEANKFAAELLINEKEIDKLLLHEMCLNQIASYLEVPEQLVRFKFERL